MLQRSHESIERVSEKEEEEEEEARLTHVFVIAALAQRSEHAHVVHRQRPTTTQTQRSVPNIL
jgi:hypothetical protein